MSCRSAPGGGQPGPPAPYYAGDYRASGLRFRLAGACRVRIHGRRMVPASSRHADPASEIAKDRFS